MCEAIIIQAFPWTVINVCVCVGGGGGGGGQSVYYI